MALKRLAEKCRKCPLADKCDHKQMEALGYFPESLVTEAKAPSAAKMTVPILRETVNTIIDGKVVKIYKDKIEKQLYKELYSHLGLQYGG
jgi:hypothetical protein